ncbi:hypothetical protein HDU92_008483, partial [Lobulomyces angularis]
MSNITNATEVVNFKSPFLTVLNSSIISSVLDLLNLIIAIINLRSSLKKKKVLNLKIINKFIVFTTSTWLVWCFTAIGNDFLALFFNTNPWEFDAGSPVYLIIIIRYVMYCFSLCAYQLLSIERFSTLTQIVRPYPLYLDFILAIIAIFLNLVATIPLFFDATCSLLDLNWYKDNHEGSCNKIITFFEFPNYDVFYTQCESVGSLIQVYGIPLFEVLLNISLLMIIFKTKRIKRNFKYAKKSYVSTRNNYRVWKVKKRIQKFLILWLLLIITTGIINIFAQSTWVFFIFSDDETLQHNYFNVFNAVANLLVCIQYSLYFVYMQKLSALVMIGSERVITRVPVSTSEESGTDPLSLYDNEISLQPMSS